MEAALVLSSEWPPADRSGARHTMIGLLTLFRYFEQTDDSSVEQLVGELLRAANVPDASTQPLMRWICIQPRVPQQ